MFFWSLFLFLFGCHCRRASRSVFVQVGFGGLFFDVFACFCPSLSRVFPFVVILLLRFRARLCSFHHFMALVVVFCAFHGFFSCFLLFSHVFFFARAPFVTSKTKDKMFFFPICLCAFSGDDK